MNYDALLFDFDGVLADTERIHHRSWNLTLKPLGLRWSWKEYQENCVGVADAQLMQRYRVPQGEMFVSRKQKLFQTELQRARPFRTDTLGLIAELSDRYKLAVVSSSFRRDVEPPLIRAGIRDHFQTVVCAEDVKKLKPAPDPYLLGAKRLKAKRPLVIEDSDAGVTAGQAAGFDVLRVNHVNAVARQLRKHLKQPIRHR